MLIWKKKKRTLQIFKQLNIKTFVNLLKKAVNPTKIFKHKTHTKIYVYLSNT